MITATANGVAIDVRVIPRARTSGVSGTRGNALLVRVQAPPLEGAANAEVVDVIAAALKVAKAAVTIVAGERSRKKRVHVTGVDQASAESRLSSGPGGSNAESRRR